MVSQVFAYLVIGLYSFALGAISLYCLIQFYMLLNYIKGRRTRQDIPLMADPRQDLLPPVTIQVPIFNERYVLERFIDNIVTLDYPSEKLQIQILDDSTDETYEICLRKVEEFQKKGINISCVHRTDREGYKAGALRDGLSAATGEYMAIFDADFLPPKDFLLKTLPCFSDSHVGVVQTRWEHINIDYSLITRLQAFQLNVHFTVEQSGRQSGNYFLQFNGTAGIWRRKAIEDAGGWEADTLTEDLDLSYRAQLKGWKIIYRQDIASPAELPVEMNGLKSQQFRWMKGGAENARKLIPALWDSQLPFARKFQAISHLLSSSIFLMVFLLSVLSVPMLFLTGVVRLDWKWYGFFFLSLFTLASVYFVANSETSWIHEPFRKRVWRFLVLFPIFLSLSSGLSFHNSIAVIQGWLGRKTAFIRTPKYNIIPFQDALKQGLYTSDRSHRTIVFEGILAVYFLLAVIMGIAQEKTSFLFYHVMLMAGFGSICIFSIRHLHFR